MDLDKSIHLLNSDLSDEALSVGDPQIRLRVIELLRNLNWDPGLDEGLSPEEVEKIFWGGVEESLVEPLYYLSEHCSDIGRLDLAILILERVLEHLPDVGRPLSTELTRLAELHFRLGEMDKGCQLLSRARAFLPTDPLVPDELKSVIRQEIQMVFEGRNGYRP